MFVTKKIFKYELEKIRNEMWRNQDWVRFDRIQKENEELKEQLKELKGKGK